MSDGITGKAKYRCGNCKSLYELEAEDFCFEAESGSEREMEEETQYVSELVIPCENCNSDIYLKFEVWEYPAGILNYTDQEASGAEVVESDFEILHNKPEEPSESTISLVKSLLAFRFDRFSELAVDLWFTEYKRNPKPTAIASIIGVLISISVGGITIYQTENSRTSKLDMPQSYSEQYSLLRNTEENLNDLAQFITNKKIEIESTQSLIVDLEEKKLQLEPIVNANQETIDAIFSEQKRQMEKSLWVERGISFGLGILASLIASLAWHFVSKLRGKGSKKSSS